VYKTAGLSNKSVILAGFAGQGKIPGIFQASAFMPKTGPYTGSPNPEHHGAFGTGPFFSIHRIPGAYVAPCKKRTIMRGIDNFKENK
jgi:hypothetical protein